MNSIDSMLSTRLRNLITTLFALVYIELNSAVCVVMLVLTDNFNWHIEKYEYYDAR